MSRMGRRDLKGEVGGASIRRVKKEGSSIGSHPCESIRMEGQGLGRQRLMVSL